jgi:transposase InsO family protein
MTDDDLLFRFRLRLFGLARELGSVRAACRAMGVHPSTYYRWKEQVDRGGLEMLRPRERRPPRMPTAISVLVAQRIIAFSLGHPGFGPARISAELARPLWGGLVVSPAGIYRVLRRHGLETRQKRLGLVAGYACPPDPLPRDPEPERHLEAPQPGSLVQMDAFAIGRLSGTKGVVWQYTAIDVASSFVWAALYTSPRNPSAHWCSHLAEEVAKDLASRGWKLEVVMTDNASEFRSHEFEQTITQLGATQPFHPGGPTPVQRLCGAGAAHHPRGVLEALLCPLPHPQIHRPPS